jgi:hypothetical protein
MTDHRRTPSQRAYQLPSWFFVLTVLIGVVTLGAVGWVFLGDRVGGQPSTPQASGSPSRSEPEPEPEPTEPAPNADAPEDDRPDLEVIVLNASQIPGLARGVAAEAKEAGWTVSEVGNWPYPAVVNAVYYPDGRQDEARQLAEDIGLEGIRAARPGMSTDALTVLLVSSP